MHVTAIILAGGVGKRFGLDVPKQFVKLAGKPIISHTIDIFEKNSMIKEIIIVVNKEYYNYLNNLVKSGHDSNKIKIVVGGDTRQESSFNGLLACSKSTTHVLIHDAVRPFIDQEIIYECILKLEEYDAIDVCIDSSDTLVEINENNEIIKIPNRTSIKRGQTPQAFKFDVIFNAHKICQSKGIQNSTDDCNLVLQSNLCKIHVINGSNHNIKITNPIDISIAEKIFQIREKKSQLLSYDDLLHKLNNKVIVVVGGSSGIGKSICEIGNKLGSVTIPLSRSNGFDVRNPETIKFHLSKIYKKYERIDAVVICAAILHRNKFENFTDDEIRELIEINLTGNAYVAKYSIPYLKKTNGKLVFFASSSYYKGRGEYSTYSATKAGIVNLMQSLSEELEDKVSVLAINPQRTKTPLRTRNFGDEDIDTLLSADFVALSTLNSIAKEGNNGCIIDIRLSDEKKGSLKYNE